MGRRTAGAALFIAFLLTVIIPGRTGGQDAALQPGDLITIGAELPVAVYRGTRRGSPSGKLNIGINVELIRSTVPRNSEETWCEVFIDGWVLESNLSWGGQVSQKSKEEPSPDIQKRIESAGKLSENALWWLREQMERRTAVREARQNEQSSGGQTRTRTGRRGPPDYFPTIRSRAAAVHAEPDQNAKFLGQLYSGCSVMVIAQMKIGRESWCHVLTSVWAPEQEIKGGAADAATPSSQSGSAPRPRSVGPR